FLRRRLDLVVVLLGIFIVTMAGPGAALHIVEVSNEDRQGFSIGVELPSNSSLEDASEFFRSVEPVLDKARAELGSEGYFIFPGGTMAVTQAWCAEDKKLSPSATSAWVLERLPVRPGVKYSSGAEERGKSTDKLREHLVVLSGEGPDLLEEISEKLQARLV